MLPDQGFRYRGSVDYWGPVEEADWCPGSLVLLDVDASEPLDELIAKALGIEEKNSPLRVEIIVRRIPDAAS